MLRPASSSRTRAGVPTFFGLKAVPAVIPQLAKHVHALLDGQIAFAEQLRDVARLFTNRIFDVHVADEPAQRAGGVGG